MKPPVHNRTDTPSSLSSLTRLAIGGLLTGYDGLMKRIVTWEKKLDQAHESRIGDSGAEVETDEAGQLGNASEGETEADRLRYAAIGVIFDTQQALTKRISSADRLSRLAGGMLKTAIGPVYSSRVFSPFRHTLDRLAEHGQNQVDQWITVGRDEESRSRALASTVLIDQVESSIQYLTSNDEVQELVQSQSVGLVGAIVEETREHTVSADNFLEAWVRTMLHRPMRSELPKPPPEFRARAIPYRRIQGKIVKK